MYNLSFHAWNEEKNKKLKEERGISFEQILVILIQEKELDIIENPNKKYINQRLYVAEINGYVYVVPFVEDEEKISLKTIIPSRKATKKYLYE